MRGALIVDTRTETQRAGAGELPGAVVIDRTRLDWRLDPASDARIAEATGYDIEVVVVCRQGVQLAPCGGEPAPGGSVPGDRH